MKYQNHWAIAGITGQWPIQKFGLVYLRDPTRSFDSFRRDLKTFLFSFY